MPHPSLSTLRRIFHLHGRLIAMAVALGLACIVMLVGIGIVGGYAFLRPISSSASSFVPASPGSQVPRTPTAGPPSWSVAAENALPGTAAWAYHAESDKTLIQGYAGQASAAPGEIVPLYVSAPSSKMYAIEVYRLGWYQGRGGRLMQTIPNQMGMNQGYWTPQAGLVHCTRCISEASTHRIDANWAPSYQLAIGADWPGGVYWIKLVATQPFAEAGFPLVIRAAHASGRVLANLPVFTYQAYNAWGGYSLYGNATPRGSVSHFMERATKVSFNRPMLANRMPGAGDFLSWDIHTLRWLERAGVAVDYSTDLDISLNPALLRHYQSVLFLGHGEYWTKAMRDGAEAARDAGVNLGFLGANDGYWQARLEADTAGSADRTLVCYKVESQIKIQTQRLTDDPMYATDPALVTTRWRDPLLHRPENALIGIMYLSYFSYGTYPDWVAASSLDPLARQAGLAPNQHIRGGLLGYEYDGLIPNGQTPAGLVTIAHSPVTNIYGRHDFAETTYYRAASGALVFAAGSLWWSWGLDEFSPVGAYQANVLHGNQDIMNLMGAILHAMDPHLDMTIPQMQRT